ncbi:MAG: peroxiredoxin [Spirochaetia bacterium]|jgi:peroxiredoxin (alkyl hydroperoxide reductase subunit C)|nr:peroxiredoxin [Spirochaetia bacterium]
MEEFKQVQLGDRFPSLQVKTTQGVRNLPDDYAGKWLVLFSHPGDFTPVCTTEFVAFGQKAEEFKKLNAELLGLSVDQVFAHIKWIEWIKENLDVEIPFPVIGDEQGRTARRLGMLHEQKGTNTVRAVYIVDGKGIVRLTMFYPQEVGRNVDEILRALKALQVSDSQKVACPENFPHNQLLGDDVALVSPPSTEQEIARRKAHPEDGVSCKDWWFCYKKLK